MRRLRRCGAGCGTSRIGSRNGTARCGSRADAGRRLHKITSPIVGTFYRSPGPDKDAYVSEGSKVSPETTVCIVEAMKLMNEIQAEIVRRDRQDLRRERPAGRVRPAAFRS